MDFKIRNEKRERELQNKRTSGDENREWSSEGVSLAIVVLFVP